MDHQTVPKCQTRHTVTKCSIPEEWRTQLHQCEGLKLAQDYVV